MQALRNARFLARLVLAWFVLSVGLAVAAPVISPLDTELVCSGSGGMKLLVKNGDGSPAASHTLDCPLCASFAATAPSSHSGAVLAPAQAQPARSDAARPLAPPLAGPPPARGPPALAIS